MSFPKDAYEKAKATALATAAAARRAAARRKNALIHLAITIIAFAVLHLFVVFGLGMTHVEALLAIWDALHNIISFIIMGTAVGFGFGNGLGLYMKLGKKDTK